MKHLAQTQPSGSGYVYLNKDVLMNQTMKDRVIQCALIKDFIELFPMLLKQSEQTINQLDRNGIKRLMHQMKASVALFNGQPLYDEINFLEQRISSLNDREILLRSRAILLKSDTLLNEVKQYQNEKN
jgi:hypothetical protein